ncbi:MAG: 30S ribosomal protein S19e [Candidatus Bathyarchaeia archaeon]
MPTVYDVPPELFIGRLARHLRENYEEVIPPPWAYFAKTGPHKERPPQDREWWYVRCASILRKLYILGPIGVSRLRREYGGRSRRGRSSEHAWKGGGSSVREPLQQLEKAGLVEKKGREGRALTREGRSLLDRIAAEVLKEWKASAAAS